MSHEKFCALSDELLALAGMPKSNGPYATVNLDIDGVSFSLMHNGSAGDDSIVMFCDFGRPPKERHAEVVKALLVANVAAFSSAGRESFCMNHASGHVLASSVLPMRNATGQLLLDILQHYAGQAKKWRDVYFFCVDSAMPVPAPTAGIRKMPATAKTLLDG